MTDRTYAYDTVWKDKLITRGDRGLAYDAIGNLTQYSGWTYEWEAGRRLKRQTQENTVVTYEYDHSGMRVRKTVSGTDGTVRTVYDYAYCGGKLAHMTWGSNWMHFFYDAQGRPAKVRYNGTIYSYIHNLQGDVVGIIDTDGNVVVEYKYDAWGKLLSATGSMAGTLGNLNPLRYRGYVYDTETGLYYLQSRFYSPIISRFISGDTILGKLGTAYGHNVFAYCQNHPINSLDSSGMATVYVNIYLGGVLDYGHVDITIDGITASYGRYGEVDEETGGLTGEGILVIDNYGKSSIEAREKGRSIFRFELAMNDEQGERLREFYLLKMTKDNFWKERKVSNGKVVYYKIKDYHITKSNCTTLAMEALQYAYGEEIFPYGNGKVWAPIVALAMFGTMYKSNVDIIKGSVVTEN